ncbi:MAG: NAD(P)/FAD-dependent oxidoreductase [Rhodospirillum sp.]|nr:NAD(P)/FAD-dependent oxidoreductase [Rhodospirillum sp.]MCF8490790.1 NAD(P)/FAD-dependent oxidoreductase [Rhodospirillum sp.]MCF8499851.1 NAD(P)/FAD-dependent oxidoreductase [Rhodospirillum sp.]
MSGFPNTSPNPTHDLAIIGAGPAGMAAAIEARKAGLSVVVLDEQDAPGGQIYRAIEATGGKRRVLLGPEYAAGAPLAEAFRGCGATYLPKATVWNVDRDLGLDYSREGASFRVSGRALIIASGAIERPTPLPGWTLPGVTTAGALQILLKAHGIVPEGAVLVGCGPLLYLIAVQMLDAGFPPKALVETSDPGALKRVLPHLPGALRAWPYLAKGLKMIRRLKAAGVPLYKGASDARIEGTTAAEAVVFSKNGVTHRLPTDVVALHQGVVPNQQVTRLLRCDHVWNASQHCFTPVLDAHLETSVDNVFVAGDGAGIGGAVTAALRGRVAALRVAEKLGTASAEAPSAQVSSAQVSSGQVSSGQVWASLLADLAKDAAIRPFLEALYAPSAQVRSPADETLVCRCEEITAGQVRAAVALGAPGPNQVKSFLRAGMGPCQGRMCGLAVSGIIAEARGEAPDVVDYYRIRPPLKPLALAELATLDPEPSREAPL